MIPLGVLASARVGAGSPLSIAGCVLWLDAATLTLADADPVTTWSDGSTAGNHAVQAGSAPTYRVSQANGHPAVTFGGSHWLDSPVTCSGDQTVFLVVQNTRLSSWVNIKAGGSGTGGFAIGVNPSNAWWAGGATIITGATNAGAWSIVSAKLSGTTATLNVNGSTASGQVSSPNNTVTCIGRVAGPGDYLIGAVAEVVQYDTALSDTDAANVRGYLAAKYQL